LEQSDGFDTNRLGNTGLKWIGRRVQQM